VPFSTYFLLAFYASGLQELFRVRTAFISKPYSDGWVQKIKSLVFKLENKRQWFCKDWHMRDITAIYHLIARKMAGEAITEDLCDLDKAINSDEELARALNLIIRLWNIPGGRHEKEIGIAWKKLSAGIQKINDLKSDRPLSRDEMDEKQMHLIFVKKPGSLKNQLKTAWRHFAWNTNLF
jgi:hypothetical protein